MEGRGGKKIDGWWRIGLWILGWKEDEDEDEDEKGAYRRMRFRT